MHLAEMEAVKAGMPVVCESHDSGTVPAFRDVHLENFNVSVGGRDLIVDGSVTLSFGRHYGKWKGGWIYEFSVTKLCLLI